MTDQEKGLIIIPYAFGGNTGASIQNVERQLEIYMKNVCVSAVSAKRNSGEKSDVMVVSNIVPPQPYLSILESHKIIIRQFPFDEFNFGEKKAGGKSVRWQLAYYKLCSLKHVLDNYNYGCYCFMDSDVYVQRSFDRIWEEARHNIMLYDINEPCDGYMVREMKQFLKTEKPLTHYGGEFFAASRDLSIEFIKKCNNVFIEMNQVDFVSENGDEFITSIAAYRLREHVRNASAYIRRYWTGSYRLICNDFDKDNITILHVPAEKEQGIIKIYERYISQYTIPSGKKVWQILNLYRPSMRVCTGIFLRKMGFLK